MWSFWSAKKNSKHFAFNVFSCGYESIQIKLVFNLAKSHSMLHYKICIKYREKIISQTMNIWADLISLLIPVFFIQILFLFKLNFLKLSAMIIEISIEISVQLFINGQIQIWTFLCLFALICIDFLMIIGIANSQQWITNIFFILMLSL